MNHQAGVPAHVYGLAARRDHASDAGGDTVYVDVHVRLAAAEGVKDRDTGIDLAAHAVDAYVYFFVDGLYLHQLADNVAATDIIVVTADVTIEEHARRAVFSGYHIEKLFCHIALVLTQK